MYIDTGSSMPISPSKSRDLADENKKKLTEWKRFETTVLQTMASMNYFLNISLRDDFRIGVVISPWVAVLAFGHKT